jgi:hypothetical protein
LENGIAVTAATSDPSENERNRLALCAVAWELTSGGLGVRPSFSIAAHREKWRKKRSVIQRSWTLRYRTFGA